MIIESCRYCWKFLFELKEVTYRLWNLGQNDTRSTEALNIKVIGNFINSLKRVETQNFDIIRRKHEGLKLKGFSRYDFKLELIFLSFFWFSRLASWCNKNVRCHATYRPYTFLTKRKSSSNIDGICIVGDKVALIPVVSSKRYDLQNVVSVPAEEHNNIWHTSPLIPQVASVRLTLHGQCCIRY
jgi:hypothetical protein